VRYPGVIKGVGDIAGDVFAAVRRRREDRSPRVRVRTGHEEARVLAAESPAGKRLLSLSEELVSVYARGPGGRGRGGR
jgi:hypothetical protein